MFTDTQITAAIVMIVPLTLGILLIRYGAGARRREMERARKRGRIAESKRQAAARAARTRQLRTVHGDVLDRDGRVVYRTPGNPRQNVRRNGR